MSGLHHGRLDFKKLTLIQKEPQGLDDPGPFYENLSHLLVDQKIHIALAISRLHVPQLVEFLRKGPDRLGQEAKRVDSYSELSGSCSKNLPHYARKIPHIESLEKRICVMPHLIPLNVGLNLSCSILQMKKRCLAKLSEGHDAPGESKDLIHFLQYVRLLRIVSLEDFLGGVFYLEIIGEKFYALFLHLPDLFPPLRPQFTPLLHRASFLVQCHRISYLFVTEKSSFSLSERPF
jgi:hypothetical protein